MLRRPDPNPTADLHVCTSCDRDFVVPVSVVDLIDHDRCVVELACTNCGTASLQTHDDQALMALDRHLDAAQDLMRETIELLALSDDLDRVDRFVRALRAGHILPEDF